jgi:GntR family transcriptional regulator of arabinose operon
MIVQQAKPVTKKYELIEQYIRTLIDQKKFTEDVRLPSEHFLCKKFGVSRETVRTAVSHLREQEIIYTLKGSGTFVNKKAVLRDDHNQVYGKTKIAAIIQGQDYNANKNLIQGIKDALKNESVELKIFYTDNKLANERKCLLSCSSDFQGLIVDGVKASILNPNLDYYSSLYEKDIRVIFYNNYYVDAQFPKVTIADGQCADELVKRLAQAGHRHIAGIFVYDNYQGIEKYKGYVRALQKYGASYDDAYVKWVISDDTYDKKEFPKTVWRFLKAVPKCTAIVCCNFMILKIVLALLQKQGKEVPKDYSVVAFDYSDTDYLDSGITASVHPGYEMGLEVGKRIFQMIGDKEYKIHDYSYMFKPNIHEGSSIRLIEKR